MTDDIEEHDDDPNEDEPEMPDNDPVPPSTPGDGEETSDAD